jgi:hypothetical protein
VGGTEKDKGKGKTETSGFIGISIDTNEVDVLDWIARLFGRHRNEKKKGVG